MNAGFLITTVYWVIFTVRKHFTPKVTAAIKANAYDLNRATPDEAQAIARKGKPLTAAKWALLMIVWLAFLIGALITGTTFVFGYPV